MRFKRGDLAWIRDNYTEWVQVEIIRAYGNYYTVKRLDRPVAFGASSHRLLSQEEYKMALEHQQPKVPVEPQETYFRPPDLH